MSVLTSYMIQVNQFDPTRTVTLRKAWEMSMNKRFNDLIRVIRKAIVEDDCFGLLPQTYTPALSSPGKYAFDFPRTGEKLDAFMKWLMGEVEKGILETAQYSRIGQAAEPAWTNLYVQDSYKRGVLRARSELKKAGYKVPPPGEVFGGIDAILSTPFHIDRVGLLYTRVFQDLKGITANMDTQISRILGQGVVDGDHPRILARKLVATIDGVGAQKLGITDSLGRFIPAKRRAAMLARTEVIRAHHAANIQEYMNWGVRGVNVVAEFVTAGDDRVCSECAGYHGNRYTLKEAEFMIPVHPNCRCIVIPVEAPTDLEYEEAAGLLEGLG
jgi:SPP1 gp7 family putative phage head morphogenesis protein